MSKALRSIGLGLGIMLVMLIVASIWIISEYTLVNHWIFFGGILLISVIFTAICARYGYLIPVTKKKWVRMTTTVLTATVAIAGILLATNYFTADFETEAPTKAVIVHKYQQTRHRTRRVGRRYTAQGEPYQVYKLDLRLLPIPAASMEDANSGSSAVTEPSPQDANSGSSTVTESAPQDANNGERIFTIETSRTQYSKYHKGDTATLSLSKGVLGMPVISPSTLKPLHPRPSAKRNRKPSRESFHKPERTI